jgi:phosphatidylinositol-3-phosphatase
MIRATRRLRQLCGSILLGAALAACGASPPQPQPGPAAATEVRATPVRHIFLLLLENEDYDRSFGPASPATYLSKQLPAQGAQLLNYYGTAHYSLGNYLALISGQGPTPQIQADCHNFDDFTATAATAADGQVVGHGCVYPASVKTLPDQLEAAGLGWRGYMEDMGNTPQRESAACAHPTLDGADHTQKATAADAYAARHDPFVYFHSIIDDGARCARNVVNLRQLPDDLASVATTPNFVFITPSLCHDGHDSPCVSGEPGGLVSADRFLQQWVPQILASPAFKQDGLLIITFDESNGPQTDGSACCGEAAGANTGKPGISGDGGGRVGAVLLSPFIKPGTVSTQAYNHYSTLRSIEQIFGLPTLGYAGASGQSGYGADVYTALPQATAVR